MTSKQPVLIILMGAPGSGKTHLAEKFSEANNYVHINSDSVRADFIVNPNFTAEEREQVYIKIHQVISGQLTKGNNVIFDGNLLTNVARFEALTHYSTMGIKVLFVFLNVPREIAIKRALSRKSSDDNLYNAMPEERAVRMHETFESPDSKLPQIVITNVDDYAYVENQIIDGLKTLKSTV